MLPSPYASPDAPTPSPTATNPADTPTTRGSRTPPSCREYAVRRVGRAPRWFRRPAASSSATRTGHRLRSPLRSWRSPQSLRKARGFRARNQRSLREGTDTGVSSTGAGRTYDSRSFGGQSSADRACRRGNSARALPDGPAIYFPLGAPFLRMIERLAWTCFAAARTTTWQGLRIEPES